MLRETNTLELESTQSIWVSLPPAVTQNIPTSLWQQVVPTRIHSQPVVTSSLTFLTSSLTSYPSPCPVQPFCYVVWSNPYALGPSTHCTEQRGQWPLLEDEKLQQEESTISNYFRYRRFDSQWFANARTERIRKDPNAQIASPNVS